MANPSPVIFEDSPGASFDQGENIPAAEAVRAEERRKSLLDAILELFMKIKLFSLTWSKRKKNQPCG